MVLTPHGLLEELTGRPSVEKKEVSNPKVETLISEKPRTFDELLALTRMEREELISLLTELEMEGKVTYQGGFYLWSG